VVPSHQLSPQRLRPHHRPNQRRRRPARPSNGCLGTVDRLNRLNRLRHKTSTKTTPPRRSG
jgi:hypothetical protein